MEAAQHTWHKLHGVATSLWAVAQTARHESTWCVMRNVRCPLWFWAAAHLEHVTCTVITCRTSLLTCHRQCCGLSYAYVFGAGIFVMQYNPANNSKEHAMNPVLAYAICIGCRYVAFCYVALHHTSRCRLDSTIVHLVTAQRSLLFCYVIP